MGLGFLYVAWMTAPVHGAIRDAGAGDRDAHTTAGQPSTSKLVLKCRGAACKDYDTDLGDPPGKALIEECQGGEECNYLTKLPDKSRLLITRFERSRVGAFLYGDVLAVTKSCGSPCSQTIFVDRKTGFISSPFNDVVAFDRVHRTVAFDEKGIKISRMDNRGFWCDVKRDFSDTAQPSLSLNKRDFDEHGNFTFEYLKGEAQDITSDVDDCAADAPTVTVYQVVLSETNVAQRAGIGAGSANSKALRKLGVRAPFPTARAVLGANSTVSYSMLAGVCTDPGAAEMAATVFRKLYPGTHVESVPARTSWVHDSGCPKVRGSR